MRRVIIVQARMTSTRLPGKVLLDLAGRPLLDRQLERLERSRRADEIVLAITTSSADDALAELAARRGLRCHRGSEHDVLARYHGAARAADADLIVRVTSDCPLIDAVETDLVIEALERRPGCDYAANILERTLPRGLDTEALWRDTLERLDRMAVSDAAREHVTSFCRSERPDLFELYSVERPYAAADLRWTVDTAEDLAMVRRVYDGLGLAEVSRPFEDVLAWVRAHPEVAAINADVPQKPHV